MPFHQGMVRHRVLDPPDRMGLTRKEIRQLNQAVARVDSGVSPFDTEREVPKVKPRRWSDTFWLGRFHPRIGVNSLWANHWYGD